MAGHLHNLEVTYNREADTYHPHRHAILDSDYLDQDALSWDWSTLLSRNGFPAVHSLVYLARIRRNAKHDDQANDAAPSSSLADAVFEVVKYIAKPADAYDGDGYPTVDLPLLVQAMHGLRSSDASGTIKALLKKAPKAEDAPTFAWLGTLTQLQHRGAPADLDAALAATVADPIARSIFARHYDPARFIRREKPTVADLDADAQATEEGGEWQAENLDLFEA